MKSNKKKYLLTALALFLSACGGAAFSLGVMYWDVNGKPVVMETASGSGRMTYQTLLDDSSTALDLWPTSGTRPTKDSLAEITLERCGWWESCMERFNISAMANGDYRFGVERGGTGEFHPIRFCFEDVTPGVAYCPFQIRMDGAYTSDDHGKTWRRL